MELNEINIGDAYSMKKKSMNAEPPTFIVEMTSRKILEANQAVIAGCNNNDPSGKDIDEVAYIEKSIGSGNTAAFFNNQWYNLEQETLIQENKPYLKIRLLDRTNIPDVDIIFSLKKLIGVLLHRLRSPLTGIQGYTDLMEVNESNNDYINRINNGIGQIFSLLDELERLQKISIESVKSSNFSASPNDIINQILAAYPVDVTNRITLSALSSDTDPVFNSDPGDLRRILDQLINNAVKYSDADKDQITIDFPSPYSVRISHDGASIPKSIQEELFYPFVTSGASSLGIGLTIALLYAERYNATIFLTDNNRLKGVSFTLCFPPPASDSQSI